MQRHKFPLFISSCILTNDYNRNKTVNTEVMLKLTSRAFANGSSLTTGDVPLEFLSISSKVCRSTVSWYYQERTYTQHSCNQRIFQCVNLHCLTKRASFIMKDSLTEQAEKENQAGLDWTRFICKISLAVT